MFTHGFLCNFSALHLNLTQEFPQNRTEFSPTMEKHNAYSGKTYIDLVWCWKGYIYCLESC